MKKTESAPKFDLYSKTYICRLRCGWFSRLPGIRSFMCPRCGEEVDYIKGRFIFVDVTTSFVFGIFKETDKHRVGFQELRGGAFANPEYHDAVKSLVAEQSQ